MKRTITFILVTIYAIGLLFAEANLSDSDNKTSNLKLNLDADAYITGFSVSDSSLSHASEIKLSESINNVNMTVSLEEKGFYFFYKAITDDANVKFKITVTPMYLGGTAPTTGSDTDKANRTIHFTANIIPTDIWNGETISGGISLDTKGTSESSLYLLKATTFSQYLAKGVARVVIKSTEKLEEKVPGNYTGTIKVTLSAS